MKKNRFVGTLFVCLTLSLAHAQAPSSALHLMPGVQGFSFNRLNSILVAAGFAEVPATFGSGVGGFGTFNRWRFGGEGTYFSGARTRGNNTTSVDGGLGYFYAGYVVGKQTWRWVPALGIGYGGLDVRTSRGTPVASLDQVLTTSPNSSLVSIGDAFIHTAVAVERSLSESMFLGVKASYNIGLSGDRAWKADGLAATVSDPFSNWQINVSVGFRLH
jgi:hypothetical protein